MTKKQAIICDKCDSRIAKHKCRICGIDLCDSCTWVFSADGYDSNSFILTVRNVTPYNGNGNIIVCNDCSKIINLKNYSSKIALENEVFKLLQRMQVENEI